MQEKQTPQIKRYRVKAAKVWVNNELRKAGDIIEAAFATVNEKTYELLSDKPLGKVQAKPSISDV